MLPGWKNTKSEWFFSLSHLLDQRENCLRCSWLLEQYVRVLVVSVLTLVQKTTQSELTLLAFKNIGEKLLIDSLR